MGPGDILVFLPGADEIELCELLTMETENLTVLPLYGALAQDIQQKVFTKSPNRRCIVSTNTSLAIHGVRYVVDAGLAK